MITPSNHGADIWLNPRTTPANTTHLAIGAHSDDLEIMAFHGISQCYEQADKWFGGITVTNGVGSPQDEAERLDTETLRLTRQAEQRSAAQMGQYSFVAQLDYASAEAKAQNSNMIDEIAEIIRQTRPTHLYLHQPADKHPTHLAVLKAAMASLVQLRDEYLPTALVGCEVWRDLDWLPDDQKVYLDTSAHEDLSERQLAIFQSQISAGTDYVYGTLGRRRSNGTFSDPHVVRTGHSFTLAIDLMPVLRGEITMPALILRQTQRFHKDVESAWQ